MTYLGMPNEVPSGTSKLGYFMRAGFEKSLGAVESVFGVEKVMHEGSK